MRLIRPRALSAETLASLHRSRGYAEFRCGAVAVRMLYTDAGFELAWTDDKGVPRVEVRANEADAIRYALFVSEFGYEPYRPSKVRTMRGLRAVGGSK